MIYDNHASMLTFFFPFKTSFRNFIDHFRYDEIRASLNQEIIKYLPTLVFRKFYSPGEGVQFLKKIKKIFENQPPCPP